MVPIPHNVTLDGANAATEITAGDRSISIRNSRIDSRELFASGREITIAHGDDIYRLRLTSQNKLILTK
jgi:hemin uptake protein HemP